ncbi:MAG: hypothetical protein V3V31_00605 [Methylococcales bacterium]
MILFCGQSLLSMDGVGELCGNRGAKKSRIGHVPNPEFSVATQQLTEGGGGFGLEA